MHACSRSFSLHIYMHTCRHCLSYVYVPLLSQALTDFKKRWNSHTIRPSRLAGCPAGVPDDLYNLPELTGIIIPQYYIIMPCKRTLNANVIMYAGTTCYKQCLNYEVWSHCFLAYAYKAPPFYPIEFEEAAAAVLGEMNMTYQDISVENANAIYLHLCSIML